MSKEYSWKHKYSGNEFRIDHILGTKSIDIRTTKVFYSHTIKDNNYSDHSALTLFIDI